MAKFVVATMGDKSVETLGSKIFERHDHIVSPSPKTMLIFLSLRLHRPQRANTTLNWGIGGIRELTLDANKIEQMLSIEKRNFP